MATIGADIVLAEMAMPAGTPGTLMTRFPPDWTSHLNVPFLRGSCMFEIPWNLCHVTLSECAPDAAANETW
jgi:hypothetical protein